MLGQSATSTASSVDNRIFVYEVTGLSQNELTARQRSPIRSSQNQFVQVPFHRMNQEMRRITMLGGEIVRILPLGDSTASLTPSNSDSPDETHSDKATSSATNE